MVNLETSLKLVNEGKVTMLLMLYAPGINEAGRAMLKLKVKSKSKTGILYLVFA